MEKINTFNILIRQPQGKEVTGRQRILRRIPKKKVAKMRTGIMWPSIGSNV
jgi:hypothetical protein